MKTRKLTSAPSALNTFYQRVHIWFPILHPRFRESYLSVISGSLPASAESCLVLIVAATGFLPEIGSLHSDRLDINYANAALEMLPVVLIECTVTSVQCLTAIAVYYCCIVRPIQAYDYTLIASLKIQTLLKTLVTIPLFLFTYILLTSSDLDEQPGAR